MDIVRKIAKVATDTQDRPRIPVKIVNCAQIDNIDQFMHKEATYDYM